MGFETALLVKAAGATLGAGVTAANSILGSNAQKQAAGNAQTISDHNQELINSKADTLKEEAIENSMRMRRNASRKIGETRADAGAASLATDGSGAMREMDLAARLESEILDNLRSGLDQVNNVRREGVNQKLSDQVRINSYKSNANSTLLSGFGSTISQAGTAASNWYDYSDALRKRREREKPGSF